MKIRYGFVSNSSSSSFIVVSKNKYKIPTKEELGLSPLTTFFAIPDSLGGNTEFGWGPDKFDTFADRLNWAAIGAVIKVSDVDSDCHWYVNSYYDRLKPSKAWKNKLIKVLKKDFGFAEVSINFSDKDSDIGYIDHQSAPCDSPQNFEFFRTEKALRNWLYNNENVICCQNDNDDPYFYPDGKPDKRFY